VSGIPGRQRNVQLTSSRDRVPPKPSPIVWSNQPDIDALKGRENLFTRARERNIGLKIRVRGPRGVKTTADATGNISSPVIERSIDPSGGVIGHSPA
jgi:hypothetical protein